MEGELTSRYPDMEPPINRPLERHSESDGVGISLVVRILGHNDSADLEESEGGDYVC